VLPRFALPFVRLPPPRVRAPRLPALRPPRLGRPSARSLVWATAIAVAGALLYMLVRESSLFAVRTIAVAGGSADVAADVRAALRPLEGESLAALDPASVERRLAALPTVHAASVDRAFPHRLAVRVVPERALAVYRDGADAWLVAESGRVIARLEPSARASLPRIRVELPGRPAPGKRLATAEAALAIDLLASLPPRFPVHVLYARVDEDAVALVVTDRFEIRLGDGTNLLAKLAAAAAVLRSLPVEERATLGYLDAAVPSHVVVGPEAQLSS
jgi:cell division septal protein FtsQ